jgi:hypothetical protein
MPISAMDGAACLIDGEGIAWYLLFLLSNEIRNNTENTYPLLVVFISLYLGPVLLKSE